MEIIFVLLLLVWILTELFNRRAHDDPQRSFRGGDEEAASHSRSASRESSRYDRGRREEDAGRELTRTPPQQRAGSPGGKRFKRRRKSAHRTAHAGRPPFTSARGHTTERDEHAPSLPDSETGSPGAVGQDEPSRSNAHPLTPGRVRRRLRDHRSRREIFLLKELIDPPRSRRPWPR